MKLWDTFWAYKQIVSPFHRYNDQELGTDGSLFNEQSGSQMIDLIGVSALVHPNHRLIGFAWLSYRNILYCITIEIPWF